MKSSCNQVRKMQFQLNPSEFKRLKGYLENKRKAKVAFVIPEFNCVKQHTNRTEKK